MSINSIPDAVFYDPQPWIDLAPDYDWAKLVPPPAPTPVTATAPTFDDAADTYRIPQKAGVQYLVDGVPTAAKTVTVGDVDATIVVTAEAKEGYVLEGTTSWTGTFTKAPAPEPEEPTDPEGGGDA